MPSSKPYNYHNPNNSSPSSNSESEVCCTISCLKFSLHLFNMLFLLSGAVVAYIGVTSLVEKSPALVLIGQTVVDAMAYLLIAAALVILLTAFLGCLGLCLNSHCQILTYSILLAFIFAVEVTAGVLAYTYRANVGDQLTANLKEKFDVEYGINNETTAAVDHLQQSLSCCGVGSFSDWQTSAWWTSEERRSNRVPDSCCISISRFCGVRDHPSNIRYTGCVDRMEKIAGDQLIVIGAVTLGIAFVQLLGTILACFLHCKVKDLTYYS